MGWLWWIAGALALAVIEMVSLSLFLLMLAGGALAGGIANAAGLPIWVQFVVATVVAFGLILTLRPWLLRRLRGRVALPETNASALVGRQAVVVVTVSESSGRVKLNGEVWSARAAVAGSTFPPGAHVQVQQIDGATAVVRE